jgi:hypothetical protein
MDLRFNIVYTTGTVRYLRLLVFGLLKWSDCSFRLVANACSPQEVHLLQELCRKSTRLEFLALPSRTIMLHSEVLTRLQPLERSGYFCFMDSDILATGDFVSEMSPYLDQHAGVFSATPIWCTEEEQILPETFPRMPGHFNRTSNGVCIGSTYFAMYDNRVLSQLIQSTGIGFSRYRWEEIPPPYQSQVSQAGLKKTRYDTGKLLNVLLVAQGKRLIYIDSQLLQHIGGVSAREALQRGLRHERNPRSRAWGAAARGKRLIRRLTGIEAAREEKTQLTEAERAEFFRRREKRWPTANYFSDLFQSLFENQPLPAVPGIGDREVEERIRSVTAHIVDLHEEFAGQLT